MRLMEPMSPSDPLDLSALSPTEREVLEWARSGSTGAELARDLSVTEATVRSHLSRIYEKLGVRGRVELLARLQHDRLSVGDLPEQPKPMDGRVPTAAPTSAVGPWRSILVSAVGAVVGVVAGFAVLPATAVSPVPILVLPLVGGAPLAFVIARRPGGLYFFAALAGACGAILVALSLAPGLSCPAGEFSSECVRPAVAPILLPGLSLVIVGLLLAAWANRRNRMSIESVPDLRGR
jgi:DNA-binding CsgD family transcriptional regulator